MKFCPGLHSSPPRLPPGRGGLLFGKYMRRLMDWLVSIDHMLIPIAIDVTIAILSAWLLMAVAEFLFLLIFVGG
jgi:hypothetical protein